MAIDISALWDFGNPQLSESRFKEALVDSSKDEQFVLRTQIVRCYGIRRDFERARELLSELEQELEDAGPEANVRYWLELGRTYCSTTHPPETQTEQAKLVARDAYSRAFDCAKQGNLDGLAVDALHMMTMVDTTPSDQIEWNQKALSYMENSDQEAAKKWEGSLRNNLGYALHLAGWYDEAHVEFERARELRVKAGNINGERIARWMIAWNFRAMERFDEALSMQLDLEREWQEEGSPDPYVFEELEHLYRALGDEAKADQYRSKQEKQA